MATGEMITSDSVTGAVAAVPENPRDHWLAADGEPLAAKSALAPPPALSAGLQAAQIPTTAIIDTPARSWE
jgi:hypothetical protein